MQTEPHPPSYISRSSRSLPKFAAEDSLRVWRVSTVVAVPDPFRRATVLKDT